MIQITNVGTFGRRVGAKVVPTTAADGPFETDKATEAMLVAQGVAEYVDPTAAAANASQTQQAAAPVSYDRMKKQELFDLAESRGLYSGPYDDITAKKLAELLKTSDEGGSDGRTGDDPTTNPENGQTAATGDENGQSGEIDPETAENGENGAENGGNDAGSDGSDPAGDPDGAGSEGEDGEQPPVIDAEGVVE